jgi:hypothetical protein
MPCCDTGRNIQKYKGAAASTLQDVTDNGNTTTGDIITTSGFFIGDGSKLTGISGASAAFTLQETTDRGNTTSNVVQFTNPFTSFTTSGNVIIGGNVTASNFYGDGTTLDGVALSTDLESNVGRIEVLESKTTAISYTNSTTTISSNLEINGNLSITGNTYIINSDTLVIEDRIIGIANNNTSHTLDVGIVMQHPDHNIAIIHHGSTTENDPHEHVLTIGYTQNTVSDNHITDDTSNSITVEVLGNLIVQNNLTISEGSIYGDGTQLDGVALKTDLNDNSSRITNISTDLNDNSSRITNISTDLNDNSSRITNISTDLNDNSSRITNISTDLNDNSSRITNISTYLNDNSSRITNISTYLNDNSSRITNISTDLNDNSSRINTLEGEVQPVNRGGTNITSYGTGDILYASSPSVLSNLAPSTTGYFLRTNGTGNAPTWENVADIGSATPANLYTDDYITGGPWSGLTDANIRVLGNVSNLSNQLVARDDKGDIFVSNVNAIQYYGDGGTLSNIVGSQNLQEVIVENPYTNSPPYFGAGSYGAIYGSNTINASTISTATGFYGPIKGSNTITAGTISTTTGFYGPIKGSNTITTSGVYGPIKGSNTISGSSLNVDTLTSDDASAINRLNASNINSGTLSNAYGGTGFTSYSQGDLLVGAGSGSNLRKLARGAANYVLTVNSSGSDIGWQAASGGGSSLWTQTVNNDIYYNSGNVGIQTNTPQYELDVSGNVNITQKLLVNGTPGITGNVLGINSTSSGLEWVKAPDKVKLTANNSATLGHKIMYSFPNLFYEGETTYTDLKVQNLQTSSNEEFSFTPSESLLKVGVIRTGKNTTHNSISNLNPTHTLHVGDNIIMHNYANYDVFRVNGNVFTTGHFVGDGSYITGIKQIKNETDTDVIVAGDGAPTRRSLLSRFYN